MSLTIFLVSCAVTITTAPLVRRLMLHHGVIDIPNQRSSHTRVTPRGGGLACLLGLLMASLVAGVLGRHIPWVVLMATVGLATVGYCDDRQGLPAGPRLLTQVAAGVAIGVSVGGLWWVPVGAVLLPGIVNMINFMDGINGITGMHVALWGLTAAWLGNTHQLTTLITLGVLATGCSLGFLPWNVPRARLFLGDAGSYLMGGLVGAGIACGIERSASTVVVIAPLTLYLVDTGATLIRRLLRGAPLMEAHREHVYQRLTSDLGYSHLSVSLCMMLLSGAITAAWLLHPILGAVVTLSISIAYLCAAQIAPRRPVRRSLETRIHHQVEGAR